MNLPKIIYTQFKRKCEGSKDRAAKELLSPYPLVPLSPCLPHSLSGYRLILIAAALTLLQIGIAGYSVGVGNQTIQIPFVQRFADFQMYTADATVNRTINEYPSYAYRLLAVLCRFVDFSVVYAFFFILSGFLLALAILKASSILWSSVKPGVIGLSILLAGHHHALGGADLYGLGFTHTWFGFAVAVWSFAFLWQRRLFLSLLLIGILFNLHALMAAYTGVFLAVMFISTSPKNEWRRLVLPSVLAVICALPTLIFMLRHTAEYSDSWFTLMYIRSSHHSFPLSLWQNGDTSIPRFAAIIGMGILCVPLLQDSLHRRMIVAVILATLVLLAIGVLGTDNPSIVRAQLWRCSAFPLLLAIMCIAHGLWRCWQQRGVFFRLHGLLLVFTVLVCAIPGLIHNVYLCFCLLTISACLYSMISWRLALLISLCHVVCLSANFFIDFPLFQLPSTPNWGFQHLGSGAFQMRQIIRIMLCLGIIVFSYSGYQAPKRRPLLLLNITAFLLAGTYLLVFLQMLDTRENPWLDAQRWARENSPKDAVFLTPIYRSGFRIHSQRAVVTEWRDGTL